VKWNLRWVAARRDIWRPTQLRAAFEEVGFSPSLSKVAALWGSTPATVRLEDLDRICAALNCAVADLLQAEALPEIAGTDSQPQRAAVVGGEGPCRPVPKRSGGTGGPRRLPPN
jgi:DNA-binding Xre family transcriptional regulator